MEHRHSLDFSISVLSNEYLRLAQLHRLIQDGHVIKKKVADKMFDVQAAIDCIHDNKANLGINFDHPIRVLRANLNWLRKQAPILKSSQAVIDEIEYVTKLLRNEQN